MEAIHGCLESVETWPRNCYSPHYPFVQCWIRNNSPDGSKTPTGHSEHSKRPRKLLNTWISMLTGVWSVTWHRWQSYSMDSLKATQGYRRCSDGRAPPIHISVSIRAPGMMRSIVVIKHKRRSVPILAHVPLSMPSMMVVVQPAQPELEVESKQCVYLKASKDLRRDAPAI